MLPLPRRQDCGGAREQEIQDCRHSRRRHRERGGSGRNQGAGDGWPPLRSRFHLAAFSLELRPLKKTGEMMPPDGLDQLREFDSIYLGAVGFPGVPDHVSLWQLLIPIRRGFHQYVNLRPVRLLKGVKSPLRGREPGDIDFYIVRENNEGEYSDIGGRLGAGTPDEMCLQETVFTRKGVDRIMRYAFELAKSRPKKHVTSATKSNGIKHVMPYWDERFRTIAADYPEVKADQYHVDILTAHFVLHPDWF